MKFAVLIVEVVVKIAVLLVQLFMLFGMLMLQMFVELPILLLGGVGVGAMPSLVLRVQLIMVLSMLVV